MRVALFLAVLLCAGCGLDHTGRSASYLMESRIDANKDRSRSLERDLQLERTRVDDIEERAANARRMLADSGATLETFLAELQMLRGEIAELKHTLGENDKLAGDVDFRLTTLEVTLAHMMKELDVTPPSMLGAMYSAESGLGSMEAAPSEEPDPAPELGGGAIDGVEVPEAELGEPSPDAGGSAVAPKNEAREWVSDVGIDLPEDSDSKVDSEFGAALVEFKAGAWESAGGKLQKFVMRYPESKWYLQAQFLVGQCLYELGRYKPAITEYQQVIVREESSLWATRSMFMQGAAFQLLGTPEDLDAAKVFFSELIRIYPDRPEAARAQARLEALDAQ